MNRENDEKKTTLENKIGLSTMFWKYLFYSPSTEVKLNHREPEGRKRLLAYYFKGHFVSKGWFSAWQSRDITDEDVYSCNINYSACLESLSHSEADDI